MNSDVPEPLWRAVVGDPEPWRRGRVLLVCVALLNLLVHALLIVATLASGAIDRLIAVALSLIVSCCLFAFIWLGTHWVRWLLGSWSLLAAFAEFIWSIRDGSAPRFIAALVNCFVGAALFAPSVHFFAVRQRERIRWLEKLVLASVFALLFASFWFGLLALKFMSTGVRREAYDEGTAVLRRVFVENDTRYLFEHASDELFTRYGQAGLSGMLANKYIRTGDMRDLRVTRADVRPLYAFPATIRYLAEADGEAAAQCGVVHMRVQMLRSAGDWRITGTYWRCDPQ
jgi:hypothetical protein